MENLTEEMREILKIRKHALDQVDRSADTLKMYEGKTASLANQFVVAQKIILTLTQQIIDMMLESGREI